MPDVPLSVGQQILGALNGPNSKRKRAAAAREILAREEEYKRGHVDMVYREWLKRMVERDDAAKSPAPQNLTLGYVTTDVSVNANLYHFHVFLMIICAYICCLQACPGIGDDVPHQVIPFFETPDFICSNPPNATANNTIDLVFINFIESDVFDAFKVIPGANFSKSAVQSYSPFFANQLLGLFATEKWNS